MSEFKENKCVILLPVYNGEEFLQQTIESVLNQTYENFDLVIYNDGSDDNSLEIIKKFLFDERIILINNKVNFGCGHAFYYLFKNYNDYGFVAMLGQDDVWDESFLDKQIEYLNKTSALVSFSQVNYIDQNNQSINLDMYHHDKIVGKSPLKMFLLLVEKNVLCASSALINNRSINSNILYCGYNNDRWQDLELWLNLVMHGKFVYNKSTCILYRKHDMNLSVSNNRVHQYKLEYANMLSRVFSRYEFKDFITSEDTLTYSVENIVKIIYKLIDVFDTPLYCLLVNFCELSLEWGVVSEYVLNILSVCYLKAGLLQKYIQFSSYKKIIYSNLIEIPTCYKELLLSTNLFEINNNIAEEHFLETIDVYFCNDVAEVNIFKGPAIIISENFDEQIIDDILILNSRSNFYKSILIYIQDVIYLYNNGVFAADINKHNTYLLKKYNLELLNLKNQIAFMKSTKVWKLHKLYNKLREKLKSGKKKV